MDERIAGHSPATPPFALPDSPRFEPTSLANYPPSYDAIALPPEPAGRRGLQAWLVLVALFGGGGLLFHQAEMSALAVMAGLFAVAQAADLDARWRSLERSLAWVLPVGGAVALVVLAADLWLYSDASDVSHPWAAAFAIGAAVFSFLSYLPAVVNPLARRLFAEVRPSHTTQLAARVVLFIVLILPPSAVFFHDSLESLLEGRQLLGPGELWGSLIGFVLLSLGATGFMIQRDVRQTLRRLGLERPRLQHLGIGLLGVVGLFVANTGAELVQKAFFPHAFEADQRINTLIAGQLTGSEALLLGLSAGIGEEVSMRGALQPKLGLVLTSLLFAALHIQYSWFGMGVIALLGFTLGWIRRRTNTTVAIGVHAAYDALAVLALQLKP